MSINAKVLLYIIDRLYHTRIGIIHVNVFVKDEENNRSNDKETDKFTFTTGG